MRFCVSVNGIASAGLRPMDIACNFGNCYKLIREDDHVVYGDSGYLGVPKQEDVIAVFRLINSHSVV